MKKIGKCPFCNGNVEVKDINVFNKKVKLYKCENALYELDDSEEFFRLKEEATCSFRIFSNSLLKYNKKSISEKEVRTLLKEGEVIVRFYSKKLYNEETKKYGSEYHKYIIPHEEYGVSVLFDVEISE